jgi:YD repeat-containing protein
MPQDQSPGRTRPASTVVAVVLALATLVTVICAGSATADVVYVYDELGRQIGVIDSASDTAVYSYDAVGNLLGIARYASSSVSIIDFQPKSGPVGTTVTVHGTGFSATPSSNAITFNGTAATVTSATPTSLVVTVPAGATTGTIGVTAPAGSATSGSTFTVTASSGAPTITSLSPTIALPGATITINGTNFETTLANNKVSFYGVPPAKSRVTAAAATALDVTVPGNARSGPVTVATPGGTAVSTADFFVPQGGYTPAQVAFTGRITVGGASVDVPLTTTGKQALVLFEGVAGQRLDLGTHMLSGFGSPVFTIYRPDGLTLPTSGSTTARYLPALPISGLYVIALQNGNATHTIRLTLSEEITGTIDVGGSTVNLSIPRAGQRARLSFAGTAGQRVDLGITHTMLGVTASIKTADEGTTLVSGGISSPGELHTGALPATGPYLLFVEPGSPYTGSFAATLSEEVTGAITIGGASAPISVTRLGQRARLTFTGTTGQALTLGLTSASVGGWVTVYRPGGTTHTQGGFSTPSGSLDFPGLVSSGTHEILIDPANLGTGGVTLTLSEPLAGTTALGGPPVSATTTRPGQIVYWSFPGTAGQRASHFLSGTTITGTVQIFYSGGSVVPPSGLPGTTFLDLVTLPATATYYIWIDPSGASTGSITVTSYDVPADVNGSLSINGGTVPVTISTPGQKANLTFAGNSGQAITVRVTGNGIGCTSFKVTYAAGGGTYFTSSCAGSLNFGLTLPTTGTHTLTIDPQAAATGSVTVEVTLP